MMEENNKVLVVVHEDVDFSLIAANLNQLQSQQAVDVFFIDVLKPARKNKWLKQASSSQITEAKIQAREQQITALVSFHGLDSERCKCSVLTGNLAQEVVRLTIKEEINLVLKVADHTDNKTSGRDLNLLRKCPKPFLLLKPFTKPIQNIVASIDIEEDDEQLDHDLNRRIIDAAMNTSRIMNKRLEIMSCWQLENESDLRDNPFFKITEDELNKALLDAQNHTTQQMVNLVDEYKNNDGGVSISMALVKGDAEKTIPQFVIDNKVDLLVMGTVAKAGLRGLLVGNTAEAILPALECSILAVKPLGFKTPY